MLPTRKWNALVTLIKLGARLPKRVGKIGRRARLMRRGLGSCSVYIPYTRVATVFDADEEHRTLADYGVTMPPAAVYFDRVVRYALAADFGKREVNIADLGYSTSATSNHAVDVSDALVSA